MGTTRSRSCWAVVPGICPKREPGQWFASWSSLTLRAGMGKGNAIARFGEFPLLTLDGGVFGGMASVEKRVAGAKDKLPLRRLLHLVQQSCRPMVGRVQEEVIDCITIQNFMPLRSAD